MRCFSSSSSNGIALCCSANNDIRQRKPEKSRTHQKLGAAGYQRAAVRPGRVLPAFAPLSAVREARRKSLATLDPRQCELALRRAILFCGCEQYGTAYAVGERSTTPLRSNSVVDPRKAFPAEKRGMLKCFAPVRQRPASRRRPFFTSHNVAVCPLGLTLSHVISGACASGAALHWRPPPPRPITSRQQGVV